MRNGQRNGFGLGGFPRGSFSVSGIGWSTGATEDARVASIATWQCLGLARAPNELHRLFGNVTFVWGGDLNCDPRRDDIRRFAGGNRRMFELYHQAGARDLRHRFHDDYQQTFFAPGRRPYQLDLVFADAETERRVTGWQVDGGTALDEPRYSDHAPIIVDFDDG